MNPLLPLGEQATPCDSTTINYSRAQESGFIDEGIAIILEYEESGKAVELREWLARYPELASGLARFIAQSGALVGDLTAIRPPNSSSESGVTINGFILCEEIGRGGMGIVYRAHDPQLNRDVAMKRLRGDGFATGMDWTRFRLEAGAVASLSHPNIVPVHSYGEANGSPYLVMPLLEGGSLAQRLRQLGPDRCLPPEEATELMRKIALGVHHAHQRGLLHRDLKPGNILFNEANQPHIADFGLARRLDESHSLHATGAIAGTAAYMAPEQARGEKGLTTAVDIHALGAILYELLTGTPPFGSGELLPTLKRVVEEEACTIRRLRPDVPDDLEAICMKCLEKQPSDRYESAADLAEDLERFQNGEAVKAHAPGFWDWLRQLARVRPHPNYTWPVPVWLGILLLATGATVYLLCQADRSAGWIWVVNLTCTGAMLAVFWWYMLRRFRALPVTERQSLIIGVGHIIAHLALMVTYVPFSFAASAREYLVVYPAFMALSGLAMFTLGSTNWSRMFPGSIMLFVLTPLMARWPNEAPLIAGISMAFLMWYWTYAKYAYFAKHLVGETTERPTN